MLVDFIPLYSPVITIPANAPGYTNTIMQAFIKSINPTLDPILYDLHTAQFAWLRAAYMTGPEWQRIYWSRLLPSAQLKSRAMHRHARDMVAAIQVATREYTRTTAEANLRSVSMDDMEDFDKAIHGQLAYEYSKQQNKKNVEDQGLIAGDVEWFLKHMAQYGTVVSLLPLTHESNEANEIVNRMDFMPPDFKIFYRDIEPVMSTMLDDYMSDTAVLEAAMHSSCRLMLNQFIGNLTPPTKKRLLKNDAIPKPKVSTILGWWHLCGLASYEMPEIEREAVSQLGPFSHIAAFILPAMPMTYDHRNGGGVQDAASDARDSLSSRSTEHERKESGAIDHGHWTAYGVMFNPDDPEQTHIFACIALQSLRVAPSAILATLSNHLPEAFHDKAIRKFFHNPRSYPSWKPRRFFCPQDEELEMNDRIHWMGNLSVDSNLRDVAANFNTVLQFTADDAGSESAVQWVTAFIRSLSEAWRMSPIQLNGKIFTDLTLASYTQIEATMSVRVKGKGSTSATFRF